MIKANDIDMVERGNNVTLICLEKNAFLDKEKLEKSYYENFDKFKESQAVIIQSAIELDEDMYSLLQNKSEENNQRVIRFNEILDDNIESLIKKLEKFFGYIRKKDKYYISKLLSNNFLVCNIYLDKQNADLTYYADISKFNIVNSGKDYYLAQELLEILKAEYCTIGIIVKSSALDKNMSKGVYKIPFNVKASISSLAWELEYNDYEIKFLTSYGDYDNKEYRCFVKFYQHS